MIYWIILAIIIFLLLLILITKLSVEVNIQQIHKDFDGKVTFSVFFRLIRYTIEIPAIDLDEESPSIVFKEKEEGVGAKKSKEEKFSIFDFIHDLEILNDFLKDVVGFYKIVEEFLAKTKVTNLIWKTHFGVDDAAITGQLSGLLWSAKGSTLGVIGHYMKLINAPTIEVNPDFQKMMFASQFKCMVSFRIGYAIHAGLKVLRHRKKSKKRVKNYFNHQQGRNVNV